MKRRRHLRSILIVTFFTIFIVSCSLVFASAESSVRITKPVNGSTVKPGNIEIWTTFDQPTGDWSGQTLAADYTPVTLRLYKGSTMVTEQKITPSGIKFTAEGGQIASITINDEGTYTLKASVPKTSGQWNSVTFKVSKATASDSEDDGPEYSISNPGYFIYPGKNTYNAKPGQVVKIPFSMSVNAASTGTNKFLYYSDHVPDGSKNLIQFKGLSEYKWTEKDGNLVANGTVEYTCLKNGSAKLYMYVLVNGIRYDKKVVAINIGDAAVASSAANEKIVLPKVKIKSAKASKKSMTVKWKKVSKANLKKIKKIEIQYSPDKSFSMDVKTKLVSAKKTSCKIKGLKSKGKYYVRIRAYTKSGSEVRVSKWTGKKSAKIK